MTTVAQTSKIRALIIRLIGKERGSKARVAAEANVPAHDVYDLERSKAIPEGLIDWAVEKTYGSKEPLQRALEALREAGLREDQLGIVTNMVQQMQTGNSAEAALKFSSVERTAETSATHSTGAAGSSGPSTAADAAQPAADNRPGSSAPSARPSAELERFSRALTSPQPGKNAKKPPAVPKPGARPAGAAPKGPGAGPHKTAPKRVREGRPSQKK